ncbi:TPA: TerB family tellurite resistance protein [Vibrio cholerae]|uniref:tellurite resistance TerB family protein n=1 Tax=Vibrio cholerae TaxID=666 RepID=UPI00053C8E03|nr:TerB family tellurite resistance protein [Vibrio cholerae]MCX9536136.1 TerB family tellurite resistance protein [Vibrio cholerae]HAS3655844.1 TerB family tellurite resistance protein [Vibrio cholerae]
MSFWKILGGAALGVGAVAAAPFTGGGSVIGAATLAASLGTTGALASAAAAAAAGAYAGKKLSDSDNEKKNKAYNSGKADGEAETRAKMQSTIEVLEEKLSAAINEMKKQAKLLDSVESYYKQLLALEVLGVAVAWCDGKCTTEERAAIDNFVQGINRSGLPKHYIERAQNIAQDAESGRCIPNVNDAFKEVTEAHIDMKTCEQVIMLVSLADKEHCDDEYAFLQAWKQLAA